MDLRVVDSAPGGGNLVADGGPANLKHSPPVFEMTGTAPRWRIQKGKTAGIAKVLIADGPDHAGMAIIIDPLHVLTCAHVVNVALGEAPEEAAKPDRAVAIAFPMIRTRITLRAHVVAWRPAGDMPQDDVAVLRLEGEAPEEAGVAIFADLTGMSPDGDQLSVYGMSKGQRIGNHIDAEFKGPTSAAWVQIDGAHATSTFIQGGFSGAAVWDIVHSAVLGMVVAKKLSDVQRVAYIIPTAELAGFWPQLPVENRPLPASFARTWTVFTAVFFLLALAHWAVDRGVSSFSVLTVSGDHKQLAAFWGMHIYAFLAPILLIMLIAYAKAFRLHDWKARIPSFASLQMRPTSSSTWRTAAMSLVFFVVLPMVAQVHFIQRFHKEGHVYVYPSSFGFGSHEELLVQNEECFPRGSFYLCKKRDAQRYSLAAPKPGSPAGFWDNAYHYGELSGKSGNSVTFFPILQPIAILLLSAIGLALSGVAFFLVFRPTPDQVYRNRKARTYSLTE